MRTRHKLTALLGTGLMIASLSSFAAEQPYKLTPHGKASTATTPETKATEDCGTVYWGGREWGYFTRTLTQLNMDPMHAVETVNLYSYQGWSITLQGVTPSSMFKYRGAVSATNISAYAGAMYSAENDGNSTTYTITF
jgi:hypothetical protein